MFGCVVVPGAVNSLADLLSVYILPDQSATCGDKVSSTMLYT